MCLSYYPIKASGFLNNVQIVMDIAFTLKNNLIILVVCSRNIKKTSSSIPIERNKMGGEKNKILISEK